MITVLTPTYNRVKHLKNLFYSLQLQTNKKFVWLIIDDGSDDSTKIEVEKFCEAADFKIEYQYKANGGKHTALNHAYSFILTDLTFIVDSDDELTSDAIETIEKTHAMYKNERDLCGYSFLRGKRNGGYLSSGIVPKDGLKEDFVSCRINRHLQGDMAEVWYSECLREFPFPEFEGEKFLGEDIVWLQLAKKYKMRFFNKVIYMSDYLEEGLTSNRRKHNMMSPKGCTARAKVFLESNAEFTIKLKAMLQYQVYGKFAQYANKYLMSNVKQKGLYVVCVPLSKMIYVKWKYSKKINLLC